jgi:cytochrome c oxidase assembly factor CtaG
MSPEMHGDTTLWSVFADVALVVFTFLYLRGWFRLSKTRSSEANAWRASAFLSGELIVSAIVASPLAGLDRQWLTAHMLQHLVLMTLAAPLILLGEPARMFMNSLPAHFDTARLGRLLEDAPVRGIGRVLINPAFCWLAGTVCVIVWHIPGPFNLCMRSSFWHHFEQASFFAAGLLFWWPVVQPWPSIARWERWTIPMYLFLATIPCDALSAFLAFCGRVVYPMYASSNQLFNNSAQRDQELAGAMMWVWVTFVYLIPAVFITMLILAPADTPGQRIPRATWSAPEARSLNGRAAEEL